MNVQFGSGVIHAKPVAGNQATNPTPYRIGVLQEASVDFKGDLKRLYGQKQLAVATARGKLDVEGKLKAAVFDAGMLSQLYFGQNATVGTTKIADQVGPTAIPTTPFQITPVVPGSGTYLADYGVQFIDGTQLTKVAAGPAAGQYSVNEATGVYTFASADNVSAKSVLISFSYTLAATGKTIAINNQLMGFAPEVKLFMWNTFRTNFSGIELNDVTLGQLQWASKQEDFWLIECTFSANADINDVLGKLFID